MIIYLSVLVMCFMFCYADTSQDSFIPSDFSTLVSAMTVTSPRNSSPIQAMHTYFHRDKNAANS